MNSTDDSDNHKRPVNLSLDESLAAHPRAMADDLSAEAESPLMACVRQQTHLQQAEALQLKRSAGVWNCFTDQHGAFADEFPTL